MIQTPFSNIGTDGQRILEAKGHYITLKSGHCYFDAQAGGSANMLGHNILEINKVKMGNFCSDWDLVGPTWDILTNKLVDLIGTEYIRFIPALTGTDAVDTAIKLAWGRNGGKIVVRPNSYHSGSISGWQLSDRSREFTHKWSKCNWFVEAASDDNPDDILRLLKRGSCSAILVDALTWSNGARFVSPEYWYTVAKMAKDYNVPLIVDEVLTGFGKLGAWSYFVNVLGIAPDIVIFGKNMTAGHDQLAMVCIHEDFLHDITGNWLAAGNTKSFNECGAAVTLKNIEILERDCVFEYLNEYLIPEISDIANDIGHDIAKAFGTTLVIDRGSPEKNYKFHLRLKRKGIWQRFWKSSYFHIFYNITPEELGDLRKAILESI